MNSTQARQIAQTVRSFGAREKTLAVLTSAETRQLNRQMEEVASIRAAAEGGMVCFIEGGQDCDGVAYSGRVHGPFPATLQSLVTLRREINEWADGPFWLAPTRPSRAAKVQYTSRDLTLEAFEDGHAHCLHA